LSSCTTQCRVTLLCGVVPLTRRRDLHHPADRLDAVGIGVPVVVFDRRPAILSWRAVAKPWRGKPMK
jgi:hypothetical protein